MHCTALHCTSLHCTLGVRCMSWPLWSAATCGTMGRRLVAWDTALRFTVIITNPYIYLRIGDKLFTIHVPDLHCPSYLPRGKDKVVELVGGGFVIAAHCTALHWDLFSTLVLMHTCMKCCIYLIVINLIEHSQDSHSSWHFTGCLEAAWGSHHHWPCRISEVGVQEKFQQIEEKNI